MGAARAADQVNVSLEFWDAQVEILGYCMDLI